MVDEGRGGRHSPELKRSVPDTDSSTPRLGHSTFDWVFFNEQRLRSGWRIGIFFLLLLTFFAVGQVLMALLPRALLMWVALFLLVASSLAAGWIVLARLDGRPIGALGFALTPATGREIGGGLLVGAVLVGGAALLIFATGSAHFVVDDGTATDYVRVLLWTFVFFSLAAAWEELVFRGYPFQALVEGIGAWPATVVASLAFAWVHGQNPNVTWLGLANIFLAGVLLSVAYLRTRSLWFATAVHVGWNWMMASVIDFPVSGLEEGLDTPLYSALATGPAWWTGGDFGPEGGLAATLALGAGLVWMVRSPRLRPAPEMLELGPIVERRLRGRDV